MAANGKINSALCPIVQRRDGPSASQFAHWHTWPRTRVLGMTRLSPHLFAELIRLTASRSCLHGHTDRPICQNVVFDSLVRGVAWCVNLAQRVRDLGSVHVAYSAKVLCVYMYYSVGDDPRPMINAFIFRSCSINKAGEPPRS